MPRAAPACAATYSRALRVSSANVSSAPTRSTPTISSAIFTGVTARYSSRMGITPVHSSQWSVRVIRSKTARESVWPPVCISGTLTPSSSCSSTGSGWIAVGWT